MTPGQLEPSDAYERDGEIVSGRGEDDVSLDAMLKRVLPDEAARLNSVQVALFNSALSV